MADNTVVVVVNLSLHGRDGGDGEGVIMGKCDTIRGNDAGDGGDVKRVAMATVTEEVEPGAAVEM